MPSGLPDFWQGTIAGMPAIGAGQLAWYMSDAHLVTGGETYDLINYVVPDLFELHVCSGVVSCGLPRLQRYELRQTPAATWLNPTGYSDPESFWTDEILAYDNDFITFARGYLPGDAWGEYLILTINPSRIDKVRFYALYFGPQVSEVDLDVYYEGAWHDIYDGIFADREWVEAALDEAHLVIKARIRFYNPPPAGAASAKLYEFQFNTAGATAQEGIWFDTHAVIPYLPQAPYIVEPKATFAVRVYNDDEEDQNMSVALAGFLQLKTL